MVLVLSMKAHATRYNSNAQIKTSVAKTEAKSFWETKKNPTTPTKNTPPHQTTNPHRLLHTGLFHQHLLHVFKQELPLPTPNVAEFLNKVGISDAHDLP